MKRIIKNIIAIVIVIVMGVAVFFTMNMAKSNLNKANSNGTQMSNNTPPGMASGDNNSSDSNRRGKSYRCRRKCNQNRRFRWC